MINKFTDVFQAVIFGLLYTLIILLIFFLIFFSLSAQTIYPGITISGINVGGKTAAEARQKLQNNFNQPQNLNLTYNEQTFSIPLTEINFKYQYKESAQKAYAWGKNTSLTNQIKNRIVALQGKDLPIEYQYNQLAWQDQLASISAQIERPAIPPTIEIQNNQVFVENGQRGLKIVKEDLTQKINKQFSYPASQTIPIPVKTITPAITQQQALNTKERAEKLIGKKIVITDGSKNWELTDKEIINFLGFNNDFQKDKIASWTAQLAASVKTAPQNALFKFADNQVIEFKPAKKGRQLNQEQTQTLIQDSIQELIQAENKTITLNLPFKYTDPEITTDQVNDLGIKEPIGIGKSSFNGSSASRIYNINLASERISGKLLPPGEVFSFNQTLGEVSQNTGYRQSYIIKDGKTILGDGGGVCQVSTTLFRTALNSGLEIIERHAHAYRVTYYEQNSPPGIDATVFSPTVDFKFKNNTNNHLLIQREYDPVNKNLSFVFYGTDDKRRVTVSKPRIWDQTPPPPDRYQDDPSLPAGTVKQIDWKAWGAKVAFDYQVVNEQETLSDRTFYSNYQPWQAVYLRGTGGQ